ncbi:MAG: putative glycoside hydrolase [Treponema sp.]|nr:putative glycoside hydrolase [Treponema sp.]
MKQGNLGLYLCLIVLFAVPMCTLTKSEIKENTADLEKEKPEYRKKIELLPETKPEAAENPATEQKTETAYKESAGFYAGTDEGLFFINSSGEIQTLWNGGAVKKILFTSAEKDALIILTSEGILISEDNQNWKTCNQGLPVKTIKIFKDGKKSFLNIVQEIKDVEINPADPMIMVCNTKDRVFLSRNQGRSWTALKALPYNANGIKAVASAFLPELTVFMSHSIYGIHYIQPDTAGSQWIQIDEGMEKLETTDNPDEISDIAVIPHSNSASIFVSQTFRRNIYKLDWNKKIFIPVFSDNGRFGTVDSLCPGKNDLYFLYEGTAASVNLFDYKMSQRREITDIIRRFPENLKPNCIMTENPERITLSELWLLDEPKGDSDNIAANKEGIYMPAEHAINSGRLNSHINLIKKAGLNMVVIDMKDDEGRLRFTPRNPAISGMGRVFRPLNIDQFLKTMKDNGIYTVARIVVFKDQELAEKEDAKYAVWDRHDKPWTGIATERWVDPYSEEIWEYIAAISQELYERGFDEIQYDYIRFPTDGTNLRDAHYRWQDKGMDMESAILSFLRHIRSRVKAPISIDIYGANSWYRTGARTGQEVELLAPWVDVICPMYYPSHFEQYFLAQNPPELRPWRIYYTGTMRNSRICRGQVVIRPWVQAFYLNVSYDRQYYNKDYVRRQVEGVREAGTGGFTYWNNAGRYEDVYISGPNAESATH